MISVQEAKQLVNEHCHKLESVQIDLYKATGFVLAEDIHAQQDSPPFNQSAMDGYAYAFSEERVGNELVIVGEIAAGDLPKNISVSNSAVRIFTGAQVPDQFDTVVMQEKVEVIGNKLLVKDDTEKKGMNVRLKGSQIAKGSIAIKSGNVIKPGTSGFLAGIGVNEVKVTRRPNISIISTGNELMSPGKDLDPGKVYECNTYSLNAALNEYGIEPLAIYRVLDDKNDTENAIRKCLQDSDVVILSGGVSVGDYDFVSSSLEACGVKCIFHKVKQKPGKPLYFGKKDNALVFGLPGNPAALLTCFYEYIAPMLFKMMGYSSEQTSKIELKLSAPYVKKAGLTHFLKGKANGNEVTILNAQESYLMSSFAMANCIVQLDESRSTFEQGEMVEVQLIH
jgi:molybdopterin molybdotransferase